MIRNDRRHEKAGELEPVRFLARGIYGCVLGANQWRIGRDIATRAVVQIGAVVLLGLPFAGALCYEFLELTGSGGSVPGAVAMAAVLGVSVMVLVSLTACTVPTMRALRIAPIDALRTEG